MRQTLLNHYRMCWVCAGVKVTRLKNIFQWKYENWKRSSRGKRSRNKTKRENWLSGEWQQNCHKHTQEVTNSTYKLKEHKKKGPWAEHWHQHLTVKLKDETLRPDSLGREHLLLTADSVLGRKNYRTVSVLSSAAVFFSLGFKDLQGVWGGIWGLPQSIESFMFIILFIILLFCSWGAEKGENI